MEKRPCRVEDLLEFRIPAGVQLAPDGTWVLWVERTVDPERHEVVAGLRRAAPGAETVEITGGAVADGAARISPDGARIAFVRTPLPDPGARATGAPVKQLCVVPATGGEVRVLVEEQGSFSAPTWSPDGAHVAVAFRRADPLPDPAETGLDTPLSIRVTRLHYKEDGQGYLPRDRFHIYRVEVDADAPALHRLTHGDSDHNQPAWSPDGERIAFVANLRHDRDRDIENSDIFVIPAAGGDPVQCTHARGPAFAPAWAPDGSWLAAPLCPAPPGRPLSRDSVHLFRVDPTGAAPERNLTPDLDRNVFDLTIDDIWGLESWGVAPAFAGDGRTVFAPVTDRGITWLGALSLDAGGEPAGALRPITGDRVVVGYSAAGDRVAVITTDPTEPGRIEVYDRHGEQRTPVAWPMRDYCESVTIVTPAELRVPTPDGSEVHGWILVPEGDGPFPMLLAIHGGPIVQYGRGFFHEHQTYVASGYAVLYVNPRGSQGYGSDHAWAIHRDWADKPFVDLMAAVDHAVARYPIDRERMGVLGGSYGGYMTNWTISHTERFRAACTQRTVSSLASFLWADFGAVLEWELDATPWSDPELYRRLSPLTYVERMNTPLLILQGLGDQRTPPDQGESLYVALRTLGKEAELVLFPGADHDLSRNGPPAQRVERLRVIHDWFARHLKPA